MRGREQDCTNPTPSPVDPPEPNGPVDDRIVYHLTPEAERILAELQAQRDGRPPLYESAALLDDSEEGRRRRERRRLARRARERGNRFGTVCGRWRDTARRPEVRLCGTWLREAGFGIGGFFEIEVSEGRLVIESL